MNQGSNELSSIQEVPRLYKILFGKDMDFFDMLELSRHVLRKTGGLAIKAYLYKGTIDNFKLELPCGVHGIKHVCTSKAVSWYQNYIVGQENDQLVNYRVDQSGNLGIYNIEATNNENLGVDNSVVVYEVNKNVFSGPLGALINFENDKNKCLSFNHKTGEVDVLYVKTVVDSDGYPMLSDKNLEALAYYYQYIDVRMKFHMKLADSGMVALAKQEKDQMLAQARTPNFLSQNEMDDVLNVLTSSNRKVHNLQYRK